MTIKRGAELKNVELPWPLWLGAPDLALNGSAVVVLGMVDGRVQLLSWSAMTVDRRRKWWAILDSNQ